MHECRCGVFSSSLMEVRDFHGNVIAFVCPLCLHEANERLEIIFRRAGGIHPSKTHHGASPKGSPHIRSWEKLVELTK